MFTGTTNGSRLMGVLDIRRVELTKSYYAAISMQVRRRREDIRKTSPDSVSAVIESVVKGKKFRNISTRHLLYEQEQKRCV